MTVNRTATYGPGREAPATVGSLKIDRLIAAGVRYGLEVEVEEAGKSDPSGLLPLMHTVAVTFRRPRVEPTRNMLDSVRNAEALRCYWIWFASPGSTPRLAVCDQTTYLNGLGTPVSARLLPYVIQGMGDGA